MPSSHHPTGSLKEDKISCIPNASREQLVSSFVKEQRSYARVHANQGRDEISSWAANQKSWSGDLPPPSTIVGFGTPVLRPRRSRKENQPILASPNTARGKRESMNEPKVPSKPLPVAGRVSDSPKPHKRKTKEPISSPSCDEEAALLKQRRKRKRARREILQGSSKKTLNSSDDEIDQNDKNRGKKPKIPAGYALMYGFKAENVGKNRLTTVPRFGVFDRGKASIRAGVEKNNRKKQRQGQSFEDRLLEQTEVLENKPGPSSNVRNNRRSKDMKKKLASPVQRKSSPNSDEEREKSVLAGSADWDIPSSEFRLATTRDKSASDRSKSELPSSLPSVQPRDEQPLTVSPPRSPILRTDQFQWSRDDFSSIGPWQSASQCVVASPLQEERVNPNGPRTSRYFTVPDSELMAAQPRGATESRTSIQASGSRRSSVTPRPKSLLTNSRAQTDAQSPRSVFQSDNDLPHFVNITATSPIGSDISANTVQQRLHRFEEHSQLSLLDDLDLEAPHGTLSDFGSLLSLYREFGLTHGDQADEHTEQFYNAVEYTNEEFIDDANPECYQGSASAFYDVAEYPDRPLTGFEPVYPSSEHHLQTTNNTQDLFVSNSEANHDDLQYYDTQLATDLEVPQEMQGVLETYEKGWNHCGEPAWQDYSVSGSSYTRLTQAEREVAATLKDHWLPQKL